MSALEVVAILDPGASIADAIKNAPALGIIELREGTYPGVQLADNLIKDQIVVRPVFGAQVKIQGGFTSGRSGGSVTVPTGSKGIELHGPGFEITGEIALKWGSQGWVLQSLKAGNMRFTSSSQVTVDDCNFGPWTDQVATINSASTSAPGCFDILITNSYFHDYYISNAEKHAEGMQVWPSTKSARITLRGCYFRNCTDFGILVKAPDLTDMVIDTCSFDQPWPGLTATAPGAPGTCYPDCPRGGSSVRFSTHAYPGAKCINSKLAGQLTVDQPTGFDKTGTVTFTDPGPVPQIPSGVTPPPDPCPGGPLELRLLSETADEITLGWDAVPGATGYRFSRSDQTKRSHTWDGNRTSVTFGKGAECYLVEALGIITDGGYPR